MIGQERGGAATTVLAVIGSLLLVIIFFGVCVPVFLGARERAKERARLAASPAAIASPAGETTTSPIARSPRTEQLIQRFEGRTAHTTRPFTVPDRWEIRWNFQGTGHHSIVYRTAEGEYGDLILNESGKPTEGSKFVPEGGAFYLEIEGEDPWIVEVWQLA